jgi:hypothetical protein
MDDEGVVRSRYEHGGDTIADVTVAGKVYQVGPNKGLRRPLPARYATLMNVGPGNLLFGRNHALGNYPLPPGLGYTFDYVDVSGIVLQDNGTACSWTIDYTGP